MKSVGRDFDQQLYQVQLLVKRITNICKVMSQNDSIDTERQQDDDEISLEPIDVNKLVPEISLLEYVLQINHLMTVENFFSLFDSVPAFEHYDEKVWPIPYDFTPNNIYDNGKYDINLIFGKQASKAANEQ